MYRIDNSINEGSGWIVQLFESQYINVLTYRSLSGRSYVKLSAELRSSKQGKNVFYGAMLDKLIP